MVKFTQFETAIVGNLRRCGQDDIVVYDYSECIRILMASLNCTEPDAIEYMEYNVVNAWMGNLTPAFLETLED